MAKNKNIKQVPIVENWGTHKVVGNLEILKKYLPPHADYCFEIGGRVLKQVGNKIVRFELEEISIVSNTRKRIGSKNPQHTLAHQTNINWCPACSQEEKSKKKNKIRKKIRAIFKTHYACAFRRDVNLDCLDCLTYMEDDILELINQLKNND